MGRIRTIKPEWLEDERLLSAGSDARVLSIALILLADDAGRGRVTVVTGATIFPHDSQLFRGALGKLRPWFVRLYEVRGQTYFEIANWRKHQRIDRPSKPRTPEPSEGRYLSDGNERSDDDDAGPSRDPREPSPKTPPEGQSSTHPRETLATDSSNSSEPDSDPPSRDTREGPNATESRDLGGASAEHDAVPLATGSRKARGTLAPDLDLDRDLDLEEEGDRDARAGARDDPSPLAALSSETWEALAAIRKAWSNECLRRQASPAAPGALAELEPLASWLVEFARRGDRTPVQLAPVLMERFFTAKTKSGHRPRVSWLLEDPGKYLDDTDRKLRRREAKQAERRAEHDRRESERRAARRRNLDREGHGADYREDEPEPELEAVPLGKALLDALRGVPEPEAAK